MNTILVSIACICLQRDIATEWRFVPDVIRQVAILSGDEIRIGRLNSNGEFNQSTSRKLNMFYSGPNYTVLNTGGLIPEPVYEYRHGMLIPGRMKVGGAFIPQPGEVVIKFSEYKYSKTSVRIWNLPGHFRLVAVIRQSSAKQ